MTKGNTKDLAKLLLDFKKEYQVAFPQKLKKLIDLYQKNDHKNLLVELHKLKGSGKTYGYPEVSTFCEALELQLTMNSSLDLTSAWLVFQKMMESWNGGQNYILDQDSHAQTYFSTKKNNRSQQ